MKKSYKNIFKVLVFAVFAFVFPSIVNAETVTVKFATNPSDVSGTTVAELQVEKDVTTVGDIRPTLADLIDMEKYDLLNNYYQHPLDSDVFCTSQQLVCFSQGTEYTTTMYLMEIDNTEKSYTLKSIPPKDESMMYSIYETNWEMFDPLSLDNCNESFTKCSFKDHQNFKLYSNIKITYEYDSEIAKIAQKAVDAGLIDNNQFETTDTELLNYYMYGGSLANYTSSFKNQLSNYNFVSNIDQRGGAFEPFNTAAIGFYRAEYNGTLYAIKEFVEINAPHIIYIPDDATSKKEAVEKRIKDIFGSDASKFIVSESTKTINQLLEDFGEPTVGEIGEDKYIIIKINNPDSMMHDSEIYFATIKDSSKINNTIAFKSSDLLTNVSVETDEAIPLDTIVGVNHITSGDTYNSIIKALNVEDGEVFDINLKSISQDKSITKLDNGKFLVKIPVSEKYNGKDLVVYYVDANGKVTEYPVKVADGYASFETDHFSTYTLTITNKQSSNPKTGDNIIYYVVLLGASIILLGTTSIIIKKKFN